MSDGQPARMVGAAAVELAVVLIVLVLLVFGITELGRVLYQENSLTKAVNIGARYVARQHDLLYAADSSVNPPCTPKDATRWSNVQAEAKRLIVCGRPDSCDGVAPVVPRLSPATITIAAPQPVTSGYGGGPACRIEVDATAQFIPIFGDLLVPFSTIAGVELNARTEERYIGE